MPLYSVRCKTLGPEGFLIFADSVILYTIYLRRKRLLHLLARLYFLCLSIQSEVLILDHLLCIPPWGSVLGIFNPQDWQSLLFPTFPLRFCYLQHMTCIRRFSVYSGEVFHVHTVGH